MATKRLPQAGQEYNRINDQTARRSIEQSLDRLEDKVQRIETQKGKIGSLAIRRHQFLLMGASGG